MKTAIVSVLSLIGLAIFLGHEFVSGMAGRELTSAPLWYLIGIIMCLAVAASVTVIYIVAKYPCPLDKDWTE